MGIWGEYQIARTGASRIQTSPVCHLARTLASPSATQSFIRDNENGSDAAVIAWAVVDIDIGLCHRSNIDRTNGQGHALREHRLHVYRNSICRCSAFPQGG